MRLLAQSQWVIGTRGPSVNADGCRTTYSLASGAELGLGLKPHSMYHIG